MPKTASTGKTSKSSKIGGTRKSGPPFGKKGIPAKKGWEWATFTKKSVCFTDEARKLSELLTQTYGDNVSISQFEKMIAAYASMTDDRKGMIYINQAMIEQYEIFKAARDARDSERDSFRSDIAVTDVEGGLEALRSQMCDT